MPQLKLSPERRKMVLIEWDDSSWSPVGWQDEADVFAEFKVQRLIKTVGVLLANEPNYVLVTQSLSQGSIVAGTIYIPRKMIKRIKVLGKVEV